MSTHDKSKIVLAVQGSYGHIFYATGILDAFRAYNCAQQAEGKEGLRIDAGSGCVEMTMPLSLYLNAQDAAGSMCDCVLDSDSLLPLLARNSVTAPSVRPDAWKNYFSGLFNAQRQWAEASFGLASQVARQHMSGKIPSSESRAANHAPANSVGAHAKMTCAAEELVMYGFGLPGQAAFNPLFMEAQQKSLTQMFSSTTGPTLFTNATRADNFSETYLYCGTKPDKAQEFALCGTDGRRQLLRLTPDYFFASGARPPYFSPMPVTVDGKTQHWMEGAMRCNPPLAPLIDVGATHIVLIRFFGKDNRTEPRNNAELNERFMDAMFSIPLQKEIEHIKLNNHIAKHMKHIPADVQVPENLRKRRQVTILDPTERGNLAFSQSYSDFLNTELNALSHFTMGNKPLEKQMVERGQEIGKSLVKHLHEVLKRESAGTAN